MDNKGTVYSYIDPDHGQSEPLEVAKFAYDPYGRMMSRSGAMSENLSFGFQTKYYDKETAHWYFGLRYYDAATCKWLNRDPLEEEGGYNLYAFVNNDPVNGIDYLGMEATEEDIEATENAWKYVLEHNGFGKKFERLASIWDSEANSSTSKTGAFFSKIMSSVNRGIGALDFSYTSKKIAYEMTANYVSMAENRDVSRRRAAFDAIQLTVNPGRMLAEGLNRTSYQHGDFGRKLEGEDLALRYISGAAATSASIAYGAGSFSQLGKTAAVSEIALKGGIRVPFVSSCNTPMQILMSGLTRVTKREWMLFINAEGKTILRLGLRDEVSTQGASKVLAHSHVDYKYIDLQLSDADIIALKSFNQNSTILIPGKGVNFMGKEIDNAIELYLQSKGL
ncbi:MAG: hypothetical protein A2X49_12170 [Lentisphaerae bacterium GWF2_52_8]|nr:MAG: hypothetical protein A2X49_12170 [Lentisphaerae bacterium GWF2_52_8]